MIFENLNQLKLFLKNNPRFSFNHYNSISGAEIISIRDLSAGQDYQCSFAERQVFEPLFTTNIQEIRHKPSEKNICLTHFIKLKQFYFAHKASLEAFRIKNNPDRKVWHILKRMLFAELMRGFVIREYLNYTGDDIYEYLRVSADRAEAEAKLI